MDLLHDFLTHFRVTGLPQWSFTMSPQKSFAPQTGSRSSASSWWGRWGSSAKEPQPTPEDLWNTLSVQATDSDSEAGHFSVEQGVHSASPTPFSDFFPKRRRRHRHANADYRAPIIPSSKSASPPSPHNTLGFSLVDVPAFRSTKYDMSSEENIFTSTFINHVNYDFDHMSSSLSFSPESSPSPTIYHHNDKVLKPRRVPLKRRLVNRNALMFTAPSRSPPSPLSSRTSSSSPISDVASKRSGGFFELDPIRKDRFVYAVATGGRIESMLDSSRLSSQTQDGFDADTLVVLQKLDELANWVRNYTFPEGASLELFSAQVSRPLGRLRNDLDDHLLQPVFIDKGKRRSLADSTDNLDSEVSEPLCPTRSAVTPARTRRRSFHYIYEPRVAIFLSLHSPG
ncbi:hypothetical protein M405DRAFT_180769 [Rhizopogon salebrosus TDB-379]|nr:hypothetical protein M405DRAFT_180769 [Rhizopogon salebrosus TDB-379]